MRYSTAPHILNLCPSWGEQPASSTNRFISGKVTNCTYWSGGWVEN